MVRIVNDKRAKKLDLSVSSFENGCLSFIQGYYRRILKSGGGHKDFEELLIGLSRVIYYVNDGRPFVSVGEELRFITDYMKIQRMRFGRLPLENRIEEDLYPYAIRKLSLFASLEEAIDGQKTISIAEGERFLFTSSKGEKLICLTAGTEETALPLAKIKISRKGIRSNPLSLYAKQ